MTIICKECGKKFEISEGEIDFYNSKGLDLPKRCKECINKNKSSTNKKAYIKIKNDKSTGLSAKKPVMVIAALIIAVISIYTYFNNPDIGSSQGETYTFTLSTTYTEKQTEKTTLQNYAEETTFAALPATTQQELQHIYKFRNNKLLTSHYEKHGIEMGFDSKVSYQNAAAAVISNPNALVKTEKEDGDLVYFIASTGEIVFVSGDGYIRTYFITSRDYFNRQ